MKKFKIIYIIIGILIITLNLYFGTRGLSDINRELYKKACSISEDVEKNVWNGMNFSKYPTAIRFGNAEYVLKGESEIIRKPVLPVIANTAFEVEGEVNIFVLCKEDMDSIGFIAEGLSQNGDQYIVKQLSFEKETITESQYISILYHEGFHAYQMENYLDKLNVMYPDYEEVKLQELMDKVDKDKEFNKLYNEEYLLMHNILKEKDKEVINNKIKKLIEKRYKRYDTLKKKLGSEEANALIKLENFYELFEGTARYMEIKTAQILKDNELYSKYLEDIKETSKGREKYYRSGMALCLILDKVNKEWKKDVFLRTMPLHEIL